jgi:hypothetical protein
MSLRAAWDRFDELLHGDQYVGAERAGVRKGDTIVGVKKRPVRDGRTSRSGAASEDGRFVAGAPQYADITLIVARVG